MARRKTTKEFIEEANKIHDNKYNYSLTEYIGSQKKVKIICPEHGEFEQTPNMHLKGQQCPKCAIVKRSKKRRLSNKEFLEKAQVVHGIKYDYSNVNYINYNTNVRIKCKKHGVFNQKPREHLRGYGCPECGGVKKMNKFDFIKKANKIHKNKYNYTLVNYIDTITPVYIECPEHGKFEQTPASHLYKKNGCPECGNLNKWVPAINKKRSDTVKQTNLKKYGSFSITNSHLKNTRLLTKEYLEENFLDENDCIKLQEMMQFFNMKETSCYRYMRNNDIKIKYKDGGFNPDKPAILYYLKDTETGLYKIGITNNTIEERFGKAFCSNRAIALKEQSFISGEDAYLAEQEILEQFAYARCVNESWPEKLGGRTEFFNYDILGLDLDG